ncbi:hypothetical protein [Pseudobythopirellula maris]|uniref:hypothetical protein n=1 Tax=Pseudobythopirellula maris TaxID=2527991 RepID=UPI0018D43198|nr:hypothetical protein [Pseudobythopirellula maris]
MARIVQARVDDDTDALIQELKLQTGWNESELVRNGIEALVQKLRPKKRRRISGLGAYDSGVTDLGSNKKHLEGFGR